MRREHGSVMGDLVDAIAREEIREPVPRLTHLAVDANLPHDRLLRYLRELRALGLVAVDDAPRLTSRGREFLQHYRHWLRIQTEFGLSGNGSERLAVTSIVSVTDPTARAGRP